MAKEGMRNLEKVYLKKVRNRVREIRERFIYSERVALEDVVLAETMGHLRLEEAKRLTYKPVTGGHQWGANWGTAWIRLRIRVPAHMRGQTVVLLLDLENSESLIFRNGKPVQGLSWARKDYVLVDKARGGERIELYVEAGANARLGAFKIRTMHQPEIAVLNHEVWRAHWDLSALYDIIDPEQYKDWIGKPYYTPSETDTRRARILRALSEAVDVFDYRKPTREELEAQGREVQKRLRPVLACGAHASAQTFAAMGHAHIDVAWRWPLSESVRKTGRTFANVLELMNRYPEFTFAQSQPQLYEYAREHYPTLYKRMKERVKDGRWAPTGCMWVEPDSNIPSGESLVRQILFGKSYFQQAFGHDATILWLPDVFGYSPVLPQLLERSGVHYFFSTKLAISQFTRFPYHSFHWEGIDGTRVLTHFMPAEEYSSEVEPWLIRTGEYDYAEKDRSAIQILPYGHGDGGGGPAKEHLERLKRYGDLEGLPRVESMTPQEFFARLDAESATFPKWVGELYLEYHRGTYTTQALSKKRNRQAEILMRDAEMLAALNMVGGARYPQKTFNEAWKLILLNQFHDILPGSSIDEVYEDSHEQYDRVFSEVGAEKEKALERIARGVDTTGDGKPVLAVNTLSWERQDVVAAEVKGLRKGAGYVAVDPQGNAMPVQVGADGMARFAGSVRPVGHKVFHIRRGEADSPEIKADVKGMENGAVRLSFDKAGRIRRVYDKRARREVLEKDQVGNRLMLFEDKMSRGAAAWDIDIFYTEKAIEVDGPLESMEVVERGPVRALVRQVRRMSDSRIVQDIVLTAGSARIDFATTVEWGDEKDVMLKAAFPVNVRSERARYEIQFGSIERPTHWNMPQDFARFEVPAHKWADLSEGNYGVALLNDCKYGYDIKDNVMRLTLLRAALDPGKSADVNQTHTFTYSLLPHEGDFTGGVVREGYALNVPVLARQVAPNEAARRGSMAPEASHMSVSTENVVIDTVKRAEDSGSVIVRLYEAHGWRGPCRFRTSLPVRRVVETDLMENDEGELGLRNGAVSLEFGPFQVRTLRLELET